MKKPNKLHTILSVASCKLTRSLLRKTGRGGTAIPGIVALKISKDVLSVPSREMKIVLVTGTNGKTTTCNMIAHAITGTGRRCLLNKSGANLLHGIASDLVCSTDWQGRPKYPYAVLECDEAALKQVVPLIQPAVIVVTNLFSDQVDRYGGVQNTLAEIRRGIELSPSSTLVLNAEDPLSSSLALKTPNRVLWFGLDQTVGNQGDVDLTDAGTCPVCGGAYEYDYHIYAHLGGFRCPGCGYKRQEPHVAVTSIDHMDAGGTAVRMKTKQTGKEALKARIALPAVYNVYNAAAAVGAALGLGLPAFGAIESLASLKSSFGRLETFDLGGVRLQMILVKNPAGCNQALSYVTGFDEDYTAVLCLNNRTGDGHDISWIETTDYEMLCADPRLKKIYVAGDRARDLFLRLKRAGAAKTDANRLEILTDYDALLERLEKEGRPAYLLPNYTSMMELRQAISKKTGSGDFWE